MSRKHPALLFSFLLSLVAGCPNTKATQPSIDGVEPEGDVTTVSFRLKVTGRGFGLKSVTFNVAKREGQVAPTPMSLQIARGESVIKRIDGVTVESPRVVYADVELSDRLPGNQRYDVALLDGTDLIARLDEAFFVPAQTSTETPADGGLTDGGDLIKDASLPDGGDMDAGVDTGVDGGADAGDTGVEDAGAEDAGVADSGLGPFEGAFGFRRLILPNNAVVAPAGVTIEIPVPHASMLTSSTALAADGADLAVYQGPDRLEHQWSDRFALGTDQLVIVARLVRDLPIGGSETDPLVLYSGDPGAALQVSDGVFQFAERFFNPVANNWYVASNWVHCNIDRPFEVIFDQNNGPFGAYCAIDRSASNLSRATLATPNLAGLDSAPGANLTYDMSAWLAGRTIDGAADITYFSYGPVNDQFDNTTDLDPTAFSGFVPNGTLTFQDTDNQNRTVNGWRFPPDAIQWWQRTRIRFVPAFDAPALHFRFVSTNANTSNNSFFSVDDWWVRLALEPDFAPVLGPVEAR